MKVWISVQLPALTDVFQVAVVLIADLQDDSTENRAVLVGVSGVTYQRQM
jgi:hypothetical protein